MIVSDAPSIFVVQPALQVSSLRKLQTLVRDSHRKLHFASPGTGTPTHVVAEWFGKLADVKLSHIPYRGSPAAVVGLLSNDDVQIYCSILSNGEGIRADKLKTLAVAAHRRLSSLPNVPTTAESFPALVAGAWWAVFAPKATDKKIVDRLATAVRAALADSTVSNRSHEIGMSIGGECLQEWAARI